jgi:anti-sigma factor RsiW
VTIRVITEADLQCFIDHSLAPEKKTEVENYLHGDLSAAQRVGAYERQAEALRRTLGPVGTEDVPASLNTALHSAGYQLPRQTALVLGVVAGIFIGALAGWSSRALLEAGTSVQSPGHLQQPIGWSSR